MIFDSVKKIISQQKEIDRLNNLVDYYETSARKIALNLDKFCDKSLPYPEMISDAALKAGIAIIDLEDDNKALESLVEALEKKVKSYGIQG